MDSSSILTKTAKGVAELDTRTHRLAQRLRNVLIVVDGKRTIAEVAETLGAGDAIAEDLVELVVQGYLAEIPRAVPVPLNSGRLATDAGFQTIGRADEAQRLAATKRFLEDAIRSKLGLRGLALRLKVRRCKTLHEAGLLIDVVHASIVRTGDEAVADALADQTRRLMGR